MRVVVLATPACAHLPVRVDATPACEGRFDDALELVERYDAAIVLAAHSTSSYTQTRFDEGNFALLDPGGRPYSDEYLARAHWVGAVDRAAARIDALGSRLVVIDQTPSFPEPVVGQTMLSSGPRSAHLDRDDLDELREPVRTMTHEVLAPGAWVDPAEALCDADGCDSRIDGVNWYFDEGHLNRHGSAALAPFFEAELGRLLGDETSPVAALAP